MLRKNHLTFKEKGNTVTLEIQHAYSKAMSMGFYITQRGEGRIWFLHAPDGRTCLMALTRDDLLKKIPTQFDSL
jgi:hypothetical protein